MSTQPSKIAVIGNCYLDEILSLPKFPSQDEKITAENILVTLGGSATNVASALVKLGSSPLLFSLIGNDYAAVLLRQELKKRKIPTKALREVPGKTGKTIILLTPDGTSTKIGFPGVCSLLNQDLNYDQLKRFSPEIKHFHLASVSLSTLQTILNLKMRGQTVSVDIGAKLLEAPKKALHNTLSHVDLLFANRQSFYYLFEKPISLSSLQTVPLDSSLIITSGEKGIYAKIQDSVFHQPALPTRVIDTTGAGDMVAAFLLHSMYTEKQQNMPLLLQKAVIAASIKIQTMGGSNGQPTMEEILAKEQSLLQS